MANAYINIFKGNPTANATDGTVVSTDSAFTAPISLTLDTASLEAVKVKLAIRCESGCTTQGNTVISAVGTNANKWQFSTTENGTYNYTLTLSNAIPTTNLVFYARVIKEPGESLAIDRSTKINVQTKLVATD